MTEIFNFDFFQIPHVGVQEPDTEAVRADGTYGKTVIRRPFNMKIANFGALDVSARLSSDYTRTNTMIFMNKDNSLAWDVLTENAGIGMNVGVRGTTVVHNPLLWGSTVKYTRDDQFIRMTMSKDTGTSSLATQIDPPRFDVMDEKEVQVAALLATSNSHIKNWPSEGWRSFGGKYDFLPYDGGILK